MDSLPDKNRIERRGASTLGRAERRGLRGGIAARPASRPAGRRASPPKEDFVENRRSVEWGLERSEVGF